MQGGRLGRHILPMIRVHAYCCCWFIVKIYITYTDLVGINKKCCNLPKIMRGKAAEMAQS